jgi:VanZ family protein
MTAVEARSQSVQVALRSLAPLSLMALIFILSAQPDLDSGLGTLDLVLRKLAHGTEFALLTLAWAWALRPATRLNVPLAALIALLYAASDEYHQSFVAGRNGTPADVLVDAIGVAAALALVRYHRSVRCAITGTGRQG